MFTYKMGREQKPYRVINSMAGVAAVGGNRKEDQQSVLPGEDPDGGSSFQLPLPFLSQAPFLQIQSFLISFLLPWLKGH